MTPSKRWIIASAIKTVICFMSSSVQYSGFQTCPLLCGRAGGTQPQANSDNNKVGVFIPRNLWHVTQKPSSPRPYIDLMGLKFRPWQTNWTEWQRYWPCANQHWGNNKKVLMFSAHSVMSGVFNWLAMRWAEGEWQEDAACWSFI